MTPTSENTFDIEYLLQMDIGGYLPTWLATPILIDSVKNLFRTAEGFFADDKEGGDLDLFLQKKAAQNQLNFANRQGLLMTP